MLALTREFSRLDAALRRGEWQSQWAVGSAIPPVWPELAGKTLGILGYGRIGQAIARRARAFDMRICAIRRNVGLSAEDDLDLLGGPDMIGRGFAAGRLCRDRDAGDGGDEGYDRQQANSRLMKPTAFLINVARAEIVDEDGAVRCAGATQLSPERRWMSGIAIRAKRDRPRRRPSRFTNCPTC